jgi:hypothetical protein
MTAPTPPPRAGDREPPAAADAAPAQPDPIAISPAIGPVPPVYVPRSPNQAATTGLVWHATVRAVRLVGRWVIRRPHRRATHDGESQSTGAVTDMPSERQP